LRTTRSATRSLLRMSTCVAMMAGLGMPPKTTALTGSGLKSTTTLALAVYCLGSIRLTPTVVPTVSASTSSSTHQRARRTERNWPRVMGGAGLGWAASGLGWGRASEQAFAHEDDVAVLDAVVHAGGQDLDLALGVAAVHADALVGA